MEDPLCRNKAYPHPNHYQDKYLGYCLDCSNAGVAEYAEKIEELEAEVHRLKALTCFRRIYYVAWWKEYEKTPDVAKAVYGMIFNVLDKAVAFAKYLNDLSYPNGKWCVAQAVVYGEEFVELPQKAEE